MHNILEDVAQTDGLRETSSGLKLFIGLSSILISVSSPGPVAPLLVAASMSAALLVLARIPARFYVRLLLVPVLFAATSIAVVLFITGGGAVLIQVPGLPLAVTVGGANLAVLLLARVFGGMCSLYFIALTTPMTEILDILRRLRVPAVCIDVATTSPQTKPAHTIRFMMDSFILTCARPLISPHRVTLEPRRAHVLDRTMPSPFWQRQFSICFF